MLQLLKKRKLYTKLGPETLQNTPIIICIKIHLHHLQITSTYKDIFTTGISNWTTASSVKSIWGITLSVNVSGNIKSPYFDAIISPTLKNCKWLKKLFAASANDHVIQSFEVFF